MRVAILIAAGEQFADRGYLGASLNLIAQQCDLTKGALYFHYRNKQELADAVTTEMLTRWSALRARVAALGLDPLRALMAEVDQLLDAMAVDPMVRGGVRLADVGHPAVTFSHLAFGEDAAREQLTRARDLGLLLPLVEPPVVARQLVALLIGHRTLCMGPESRGLEEIRAHLTDAFALLLPAITNHSWIVGWAAETRLR